MRIKLTGQYSNGNPYNRIIPKDQLSQEDAEIFLQDLDLNAIQANDNGFPLNHATLQVEIIDDEIIEPVEISRLKIALYRHGLLADINDYMNTKNGEVKIWWENVKSVDFYHNNVQTAITDLAALGMTASFAKQIFKEAKLID